MDGTSMASPIVAGAVGLMKSKNKDIKIEEVIKLLKNTSDPIKGNDGKGSFIRIDKLLKSMK
jgi:subtilisin family serine protease